VSDLALPQGQQSNLDEVSTTCDSGWVCSRGRRFNHLSLDPILLRATAPTCLRAAHPPATAGGT